jgi:SAM-dependent methyltransferase
MTFDMEATFGDDYLYFYEESIDDAHSDSDTAEILGMLNLTPGARILDAPCGHGRIARRLAAAGMDVTGIDLTPAYLDQARADPQLPPGTVTYLEGDVRALPVDGPFDAVVCWLNSFGYYDDADCHRVLEEFHRVLRPGGKVAIDTMHHDGGVRHFIPAPDAVVVQNDDDTMVEVSTFDPVRGRMVIQRTVHRDGAVRRASYFVRLPTPPEWVVWLEAAGFRDVEFHSGGGGPLELDSWELVVVATARPGAVDFPSGEGLPDARAASAATLGGEDG